MRSVVGGPPRPQQLTNGLGLATCMYARAYICIYIERHHYAHAQRSMGHGDMDLGFQSGDNKRIIPSEARFYSGSAEIVWLQSIFIAWF